MAAISVGKRVDGNQAVMKADGEFIGSIGSVFQPIACIAQQSGESVADFMVGNADVLFGGSIGSRPFPRLIEHAQMEISYVGLDKRIMPAKMVGRERPGIGFENVLSLPLIEFFLGRQIGNEVRLLIGRQRRIALSLQEEAHLTPRFLSSRLVSASTASSTRPTA